MPNNLMDYIDSTKSHVTRLILFNSIKTGDPIIDTLLTTVILSLFSWIVTWGYENHIDRIFYNFSLDDIKSFIFKKNTIIIEGRRSAITVTYSYSCNISSAYSDRFKAIWNYIINNIDNNNSIFTIKENHTNYQSAGIDGNDRRKTSDTFMVYQNKHFIIDNYIYAKTEIEHESDKDDKENTSVKIDKITIYIFNNYK